MKRSAITIFVAMLFCLLSFGNAQAQTELTGSWAARNHEFLAGDGLPVDFTGIPLNEEGQLRALSYSESQLSMVERQCQGWPEGTCHRICGHPGMVVRHVSCVRTAPGRLTGTAVRAPGVIAAKTSMTAPRRGKTRSCGTWSRAGTPITRVTA